MKMVKYSVLVLAVLMVFAGCLNSSNPVPPDASVPPASGSLDDSFGVNGKVITPIGSGYDFGYGAAVQEDGKIIVAGVHSFGDNGDIALVRYNGDGSLDTSFGTGGKVITSVGSNDDVGSAVALQSDGKIVVAGYSNMGADESNSNNDFALARYTSNGSLDTSFGTGGTVTTPIGVRDDEGYAVAIQEDGKIIVAGYSDTSVDESNSNFDFALVRYNTDGSPDTSFGSGGKVITSIGSNDDVGSAVALQEDGKIVVTGSTNSSEDINEHNYDFVLARYNTEGELDPGFGTDGKVIIPIGLSNDDSSAVAIQPDGKIVAAGSTDTETGSKTALVRCNSNGGLDSDFGTGGIVTTSFDSGYDFDMSSSVTIQADGKIVVAGVTANFGMDPSSFALARYNSDGTQDISFGTDGEVITPFDFNSLAISAVLQEDGKIVLVGFVWSDNMGTGTDFALACYWP